MTDHKANKFTWQAYMVMLCDLECLKDGKYPNGQRLTPKDIAKMELEIEACTEVLNEHGCALPIVQDKVGDQLTIF